MMRSNEKDLDQVVKMACAAGACKDKYQQRLNAGQNYQTNCIARPTE